MEPRASSSSRPSARMTGEGSSEPEEHAEPVETATWRSHEEVEQVVLAVGGVHEHEPARSRPRERRLRGERHEGRRNGRVHRVPALAQDACARLRRERMSAGHHTSHGATLRP